MAVGDFGGDATLDRCSSTTCRCCCCWCCCGGERVWCCICCGCCGWSCWVWDWCCCCCCWGMGWGKIRTGFFAGAGAIGTGRRWWLWWWLEDEDNAGDKDEEDDEKDDVDCCSGAPSVKNGAREGDVEWCCGGCHAGVGCGGNTSQLSTGMPFTVHNSDFSRSTTARKYWISCVNCDTVCAWLSCIRRIFISKSRTYRSLRSLNARWAARFWTLRFIFGSSSASYGAVSSYKCFV